LTSNRLLPVYCRGPSDTRRDAPSATMTIAANRACQGKRSLSAKPVFAPGPRQSKGLVDPIAERSWSQEIRERLRIALPPGNELGGFRFSRGPGGLCRIDAYVVHKGADPAWPDIGGLKELISDILQGVRPGSTLDRSSQIILREGQRLCRITPGETAVEHLTVPDTPGRA